jgi:multimeric flavodoxin WrbA
MKKAIILGSARIDGGAQELVNKLNQSTDWDVIDLNDYRMGHYRYDGVYADDDFLDLAKRLITSYDTFIFVTPVYWYAMSGIMKVFFDRLTDLITIEKDWGRKLRGKKMAVATCSHGDNLGDAFWLPFSETARYLGINYLANLHTVVNQKDDIALKAFVDTIEKTK